MKKLLRILYYIYYFLIGLPLFVIETIIICTLIVIWCSIGYGSWGSRNFGRVWAKLALWLHFCPVEIEGMENYPKEDAPCVVVANHQSSFDIYVLYAYIRMSFKWVLKEELRKMPFIGWACEASGFIFVDDKSRSSIVQTIEAAKKTLADGHSVFIFPEGSRTMTGKMTRFKKGAFVMASELDVPILPISIDGAFNVLRRGDWLAYPHKIKITIHPKIKVSDCGELPAGIIHATRKAQDIVASVLPMEEHSEVEK